MMRIQFEDLCNKIRPVVYDVLDETQEADELMKEIINAVSRFYLIGKFETRKEIPLKGSMS